MYHRIILVDGIKLATFADQLGQVKAYLDDHPRSIARTLIVYAWNEWGETANIEPSRANGYAYLDAVRSAFGLQSRLDR